MTPANQILHLLPPYPAGFRPDAVQVVLGKKPPASSVLEWLFNDAALEPAKESSPANLCHLASFRSSIVFLSLDFHRHR